MVRPSNFTFNSDTASSNSFQRGIVGMDEAKLKRSALSEFDAMAATLRSEGVRVYVVEDTPEPIKPDAVFPNNWITLHQGGTVILYPMFAPNRRHERRLDIIEILKKFFLITNLVDFSYYEHERKFLEGTGSIVFDHINRIAYACISPRTDQEVFIHICEYLQYTPIYFHAYDRQTKQIYHTNVLMSIGDKFSIVCLESIIDGNEKSNVAKSLHKAGHEIIEISLEQMHNFAGNMLTLQGGQHTDILVLSQNAFNSLTDVQKRTIGKYSRLLPLVIPTIETIGGGSTRCMLAEIFLDENTC